MKKYFPLVALAMLMCSCAQKQVKSPDLDMYGFKGPVKYYSVTTYHADEDMNILSDTGDLVYEAYYDDSCHLDRIAEMKVSDMKLNRDAYGRMTSLGLILSTEEGRYGSMQEFYYHGELCDSIISYDLDEQAMITTHVSTYDEQGEEVSCNTTILFDGNKQTSHQVYTVLERDAYGNWTKRFMTANFYVQLLDEDNELSDPIEETRYKIEVRDIEYWY